MQQFDLLNTDIIDNGDNLFFVLFLYNKPHIMKLFWKDAFALFDPIEWPIEFIPIMLLFACGLNVFVYV